jgi:muramoyltetrapeptide carboxypeptidase LdcA involved in peptidoglycan recycling
MKATIIPKLKRGGTIGFFSPSFPITALQPKRFERAKAFLKSKGFQLIEGNLTEKNDFYRSGTIQERAEEFNELLRNPEIDCIISTIGGYNSNSLLPYIDYEAFSKHPKVIIGYSDMTAILMAMYAKTGIATYYGPALVASFGEMGYFLEKTFHYFEKIVIEDYNHYKIENPDFWTDEFIPWEAQTKEKTKYENQLVTLNKGIVAGRLIVGNLNTMSGIWGSEYMPEIQNGDILVIEDSLKNASQIERSFSHLKICGVFDKIGGLVLGKHEQFKDEGTNRKPYEILMEVIGEPTFPILAEYDCCHTHPMITLPIGVIAELNAEDQSIAFK